MIADDSVMPLCAHCAHSYSKTFRMLRFGSTLQLAGPVIALFLILSGCKQESGDLRAELERAKERTKQTEARLGATRAELRAQSPLDGSPDRNQTGTPQPITAELVKQGPLLRGGPDDCPGKAFVKIRAEQGINCASYQAEISSWVERCVENCDKDAIAKETIQNAMFRCAAWCTSKKCNQASFIPPAEGCSADGCYVDPKDCPNEKCPKKEYCSLIDANRVWNCFCRDMVPT